MMCPLRVHHNKMLCQPREVALSTAVTASLNPIDGQALLAWIVFMLHFTLSLPSVQFSGLQSDQGTCPDDKRPDPENSKVMQEAQNGTD